MPFQLVSFFHVCLADASILLSECELSRHSTYVFLTVVSIRFIWFYPRLGLLSPRRVLVNMSLSIPRSLIQTPQV